MSRNDLPNEKAGNFPTRLRETVQTMLGLRGDKLDRVLTLRDLAESGLAKLRPGVTVGAGPVALLPGSAIATPYEPDLTPPPTPDGFTVRAAISNIFIEHVAPLYRQGNGHLRTRVYGATVEPDDPLPTFSDAVEITQFAGTVHAHPSNPATTWRLWIKWETRDGVLSPTPAGGTNGLETITGQDVTKLVEAMTGPGNPFTVLAEDTVIDGMTFPAGTYSTRAFIIDAQVTNAKIANLAVDNAKIANLSAGKLTAGSIAVGQHIQSAGYVPGWTGWRINGSGAAEFSGVVVRGTVFATSGQFQGVLMGGSATAYDTGLGLFSGWTSGTNNANYRWRVGNPAGARIQWTGSSIEVYNANNELSLSSGGVDWSSVGGDNRPQDGATRNVYRGVWSHPENYLKGDTVIDGGCGWACTVDHVSSASIRPPIFPVESNSHWTMNAAKGEDAVDFDVQIESTNGTVFRVGQARLTNLVARVFRNGIDVTDSISANKFKWIRVSLDPKPAPNDDATWNSLYAQGYKQIMVSVDDVHAKATFHCHILE